MRKECCNLKNAHFEKIDLKVQKHVFYTSGLPSTTFFLKTKISLANKRVVKVIARSRNTNNISMYVWSIHYRTSYLEKIQCNNTRCAKELFNE